MKKSNSSAIASVIGVIVVAAILILANWLLGRNPVRADLTEDKRYSLSQGSKEILGSLESPVTIRFYFSADSKMMPEHMKLFGKRVQDLLEEYANHANGMIQVETYNPEPDSDAESTARLDGIRGQASATGEALYLGLAVSCLDATEALPVLSPDGENNLEFDLTRALYRVTHPDKITVAILSTLPVMGSGAPRGNPFMQQQQQPAWLFVDQLRKDYTVETVDGNATGIPDSVNVLIVHHPKQLGEQTLYAIDQFIMRGGKVIALVDPSALMDQSQRTQFGFTPPTPSTLGKLFDAWGVTFDTGKVVADMSLGTPVERGADGRPVTLPAFMTLDKRSVNKDDIACNSLDRIMMPFAGAFTGTPTDGLTKTVLLSTTEKAQLFDSMRGQQRDSQMAADFKDADCKSYEVAIRLTGTFKSAFPDGKPGSDAKDDKAEDKKDANHLAGGAKEAAVVLIGDADFVHEQFWAQRQNFFGQQIVQSFGDNASFLQNVVEQLSGDSSLISIRSRGVSNRQLTVIRDMQQAASKEYQEELAELEKEVQEAQQKISELQRTKKDASQLTILSPEQQAELDKLMASEAKTQKRRRELSKELRKKIDWLEGQIMIVNIGAMPLLMTLTGISVAVVRRRRRTAHQNKGR